MNLVQRALRSAALKPLRAASRGLASRWPFPVPVQTAGGKKLYVDLRSVIGRSLLARGTFDPALGQFISKVLNPGDTFVDVGANIGVFSVLAAEAVGELGAVHAFEIDPRALHCLGRTQQKNRLSTLVVYPMGLSDKAGLASIRQTNEVGHTHLMSGSSPEASLRYPVLPLDTWHDEFVRSGLRLIKLDVEGAELDVLMGATRVLTSLKPHVVAEAVDEHLQRFGASSARVVAHMESLGYESSELPGTHDRTLLFR